MARIAGVNLPNQKRLEIGLTYIYGIGQPTAREIAVALGLSQDTKVRDLTEEEVAKLRDYIDQNHQVEGDLRRERTQAIKRLSEIGAYRGLRHRRNLPVNGQRTKTNAAPRKGPKKTAGRGKKAKAGAPPAQSRASRSRPPPRPEEHRRRPGAHQDVVQQHDRRSH